MQSKWRSFAGPQTNEEGERREWERDYLGLSPLFSGLFQGVCLSSYILCRDTHRGRSQCPRIDFKLHKPGRGIYTITNQSFHSAHMHTQLFVHCFSLASLQPSSGFLQVTMELWPQVTSIQVTTRKRKQQQGHSLLVERLAWTPEDCCCVRF